MTHHHLAAQAEEGDDGKVAARTPRRRIDDQEQRLRPHQREGRLRREHRLDVGRAKALLQ